MVNHALDAHGALHYAVNNAGIGGAQAPAGETDLADWARVININLNGVSVARVSEGWWTRRTLVRTH